MDNNQSNGQMFEAMFGQVSSDQSLGSDLAGVTGQAFPTDSTRALEGMFTDLTSALSQADFLASRSDEEVRTAIKQHAQNPKSESVFDLAPRLLDRLQRLIERTGMG